MQLPKHFWHYIFTILLLTAIGLLIWFIFDIKGLYQTGRLNPTRGLNRNYLYKPTSPDQIQGWMTFSYINYIFSLPPNYLSQSLMITDSQYPNLEINRYAKNKNLDPAGFLKQVQQSIIQYSNNTH
jgi:hypothetical protein